MILHQNEPEGFEITAPWTLPAPRPSAYELATEILIPHHATTDFHYSWATHKSGWETRRACWTYGQPILPIRLPQAGWELIERPILSRILACVSEPIEDTRAPSPQTQMEGRMQSVDERLCLLRFLQGRDLRQGREELPFAGWWELAHLALPVVAKLIKQAEDDAGRHRLGPVETLDFSNCANFLRVQLPSSHPRYLLPSQLLLEEQKQLDRLARELAPAASSSSSTG